jgi:hypothetical protein
MKTKFFKKKQIVPVAYIAIIAFLIYLYAMAHGLILHWQIAKTDKKEPVKLSKNKHAATPTPTSKPTSFPVASSSNNDYVLSIPQQQQTQIQDHQQQSNNNNNNDDKEQNILHQILPTVVPSIPNTIKVEITVPPVPTSVPFLNIPDTKLEIQVKVPAL